MFNGSVKRSKTDIVYVAASVTNAPDRFRTFIQNFKKELRAETSALVLEWQEKGAPISSNFFTRDLKNVSMCSVMIAIVDEPSIGLGLEIAEALKERKPILCLHKEGATISRLLMSAAEPLKIPIKTYRTAAEAAEIAAEFIEAQEKPARR